MQQDVAALPAPSGRKQARHSPIRWRAGKTQPGSFLAAWRTCSRGNQRSSGASPPPPPAGQRSHSATAAARAAAAAASSGATPVMLPLLCSLHNRALPGLKARPPPHAHTAFHLSDIARLLREK